MDELNGPRFGPASRGTPRQLVVLCHGLGADGHDLIDLAPTWGHALPDAAFVAPDAPYPCDMAPMGRQWFSLAIRTPARVEAGVRRAAPALDRFIDAELARLSLPADAYALMGFSQGAMMVLFSGLRRPVAPRAILAFSGALVASDALATELTARPPVLLVHGEADEIVPVSRSRKAAATLRAAGVPVKETYSERLGHGIDDAGLTAGALFLQRGFARDVPAKGGVTTS
jgi:phospholipase/carboxylesterase